ncbi:MAG: hypothetical protein AB1458_12890 [Bacteroidota bacterium]
MKKTKKTIKQAASLTIMAALLAFTAPAGLHANTGGEQFSGPYASTLPGLSQFNTHYLDGKTYITWNVTDTSGQCVYYIERSEDGIVFQTIAVKKGFPSAAGQELSYSYIDMSPLPLYSFYRIKRIDQNGETTSWISVVYNHDSLQQMELIQSMDANTTE